MTLKFGTDGVRGVANVELTAELVLALGRVAAGVLDGDTFLVGRDPRVSGPMLQAALSAGLASAGVAVVDAGVLPTPALAHASAERGLPAAMISASHNPFGDNGVKFFRAGGLKLPDEVEEHLEAGLGRLLGGAPAAVEPAVGPITGDGGAAGAAWVEHVVASCGSLAGMKVVLDCANGAASELAPVVLRRLGADVTVLAAAPDGTNINDGCGSTHPDGLRDAVVAAGADAGIALDGDADRMVAVDHRGTLVDGDQVIALCAVDLRDRGMLPGDTVVVTVMTNLGFRLAMRDRGISVHETQVGDRYVLEALEDGGWALGGEQSGHVIFRRLATTGDGTLTAVQLLDLVKRSGRPLADLADGIMTRLPQVLRNVRVADRDGLAGAADVWEVVRAVEAELGETGRVLLRPSGTEPLIRVMAEAPTADAAEAAVARIAEAVEASLAR